MSCRFVVNGRAPLSLDTEPAPVRIIGEINKINSNNIWMTRIIASTCHAAIILCYGDSTITIQYDKATGKQGMQLVNKFYQLSTLRQAVKWIDEVSHG